MIGDYQFEQQGDDRFQQLVQAMLVDEFRNVQCLPVNQPDGGRDAIQYLEYRGESGAFVAFQVKYVRNPDRIVDPHKWLVGILEQELPKIGTLILQGTKQNFF